MCVVGALVLHHFKEERLTVAWMSASLLAHLVPTSLKGIWELRKENQRHTWGKEPGLDCTACHTALPIDQRKYELLYFIMAWLERWSNRLLLLRAHMKYLDKDDYAIQWPWSSTSFHLWEQPTHTDQPVSGCGPQGRCAVIVLHPTVQEQEPDQAVHSDAGRWTQASGPPTEIQNGLYGTYHRESIYGSSTKSSKVK